jgi:hypothetical protein
MLEHPILNRLFLGASIRDLVPPSLHWRPLLALPHVRPIILDLSTLELAEDPPTLFWAIIMKVASEDTHPGIYQHVWNETMVALTGLHAHGSCGIFKEFLPETVYERLKSDGLKSGKAWLHIEERSGNIDAGQAFKTNILHWQEFAGFNLLSLLILSEAKSAKIMRVANIIVENYETTQ